MPIKTSLPLSDTSYYVEKNKDQAGVFSTDSPAYALGNCYLPIIEALPHRQSGQVRKARLGTPEDDHTPDLAHW
jgi:hypothetical protein